MLFAKAEKRIYVNDVAVRDGFQSEPEFVPTDEKIGLINRLSRTGLRKIEVTSFVSPKAIPNLRDAQEVMAGIERVAGVTYVALVPNERGCERALESGVDEINLVMSIGESHNLANMRMTCEQSLEQFRRVMELVRGSEVKVNGTVATAFGCPFDGDQPVYRVLWAVEQYQALGMHSVTLADTTGMAHPRQVAELSAAYMDLFSKLPATLAFHNTRAWGWPMSSPASMAASTVSMPRSAVSAVVRLRPARPANICTKTWCTCWNRAASTPVSISTACWRLPAICRRSSAMMCRAI